MLNPMLVAFMAIAIIAGFAIRPARPPASPAFAAYRSRLRRNLGISLALPIGFALYGLVASGISASRGERTTHYPRGVYTLMELVIGYGFILLPLLALLITELGTRTPSTRVATLTTRSPSALIPRWLLVTVGAAIGLATVTVLLAIATDGGLGEAHSAVRFDVGTRRLLLSLGQVLVAAALATWVVRLVLQRPDLDPESPSDAWSRSGVAIRATTLAALAAIGCFIAGLSTFRSAWWKFHDWQGQHGDSVHSLTERLSLPLLTDIVGLAAMAVGVVLLVAFVKPPVLVPGKAGTPR
ncbi:MAG: hypothetical protein QM728_12390 [Gordonia sp. (in: high G+C Gram-positive bacteria)]|uniref:hypothetical protein n=1 Tax=Gordonia sp. (in: high G+C Gram-positive bacteria) TaxID=84139 RepID=UPI0039E47E44